MRMLGSPPGSKSGPRRHTHFTFHYCSRRLLWEYIYGVVFERNTVAFLALSKIQPDYVPFETLRAVPLDTAAAETLTYAKRVTLHVSVLHVLRTSILRWPSSTTVFPFRMPGGPHITFEELALPVYHACLLHNLGLANTSAVLAHPANAMIFELHGAFTAYGHLHAVNADLRRAELRRGPARPAGALRKP
ncbi:hypothetical protein B0H14DRAFT_3440424 [Mycena olivaceomarginata]|nr:hypothetical protein B0H14DRAFT_3440424 [Mycena olivaceomarginata]